MSFLLPEDSHFLRAGVGSHTHSCGPSIDILRRLSIVTVFNRFHIGVFIDEKTCSTLAGRTIIQANRSDINGYSAVIASFISGECIA